MDFKEPINMPRATHYGNNYYTVYSCKIKRIVHLYSNLEYYNYLSLELDPNVEKFCEQPMKIELIQDEKVVYAIFDMWVRYKDGTEEFQEVKYEKELLGKDTESLRSQEQIRREQMWCKENGVNFSVRTEKNINKGKFYLQNLNVMAAHVRRYLPENEKYYMGLLRKFLYKHERCSIGMLKENGMLPIGKELGYICYMYYLGIIELDILDRPLDNRTEVVLCLKG